MAQGGTNLLNQLASNAAKRVYPECTSQRVGPFLQMKGDCSESLESALSDEASSKQLLYKRRRFFRDIPIKVERTGSIIIRI